MEEKPTMIRFSGSLYTNSIPANALTEKEDGRYNYSVMSFKESKCPCLLLTQDSDMQITAIGACKIPYKLGDRTFEISDKSFAHAAINIDSLENKHENTVIDVEVYREPIDDEGNDVRVVEFLGKNGKVPILNELCRTKLKQRIEN